MKTELPHDVTMEQALEIASRNVAERWGSLPFTICKYGHYDCAVTRAGECFNETAIEEAAVLFANTIKARS